MSDYLRDVSVMIVDDQSFATNMLRQMVKVLGAMEVSVFSNGEEAWTNADAGNKGCEAGLDSDACSGETADS